MIAVKDARLTAVEKSQLERREVAVNEWKRGDLDSADLLLDGLVAEGMTPTVAVRVLIAKAAIRAERSDYGGSLKFLGQAAQFFDAADLHFQGAFFNQRARANKELGNTDSAFTDYFAAEQCWEVIGDPEYGKLLLNIAGLYLRLEDTVHARRYVEKAISVLEETDHHCLCQGYDTFANIELADGNVGNAIRLIKQALDLVGENQIWRNTFIDTRDRIDATIRELSSSLHSLNVDMVQWALIKTGGNLTQTGNLTGLTHKGVAYIVDRHPELERFRAKRRTRTKYKSIIKP